MTTDSLPIAPGRPASLPLRYALREMRGGLRGFYVFIACIALGVMAIAGVGSVAASLREGLAREGRTLLGGDVAFSLFQREARPEEIAFLRTRGGVSVTASLRGMARADDGRLALVEIKAVDAAYPMLGELTLEPKMPIKDLLADHDGIFGAAADSTLLSRLDLKLGDRISVGSATFQIRSVDVTEPDKLAGGLGFGPRFLVSEAGLRATQLLQPGSLVRWTYRVRLPDYASAASNAARLLDDARNVLPHAGWEIRTRDSASPQLERTISRFTQFLTLVGLASLLVGGVGVANAVKSHIDRRRDVIATLRRWAPPVATFLRSILRRWWCWPWSVPRSDLPRELRCRSSSSTCSAGCCHCRSSRPCMPINWPCRSYTGLRRRSPLGFGHLAACTMFRWRRCFARP